MMMVKSTLKKKLAMKETTIGSWVTLGHSAVAEIMAGAGFEWLTVDMEHSAIGIAEAQALISTIGLSGPTPLVRVGENNPNLIKRVMDAGAHGVIVPMVNTKDDAERAVSAVKYPPTGTRGVGLARAQGYGMDLASYRDWVEAQSVVIVQIEHIEGVSNLKDILLTEGVDAFFVGPYDLSASLGVPAEFQHKKFLEAMDEIRRVGSGYDVSAGVHVVPPEPELVRKAVTDGYSFIAYSTDFLFLGESCRGGLSKVRDLIK